MPQSSDRAPAPSGTFTADYPSLSPGSEGLQPTSLSLTVASDVDHTERRLCLKAKRRAEGSPNEFWMNTYRDMPDFDSTYRSKTYLRIQCLRSDNASLPTGTYKGTLVLQFAGKKTVHDHIVTTVIESISVAIDIQI